MVDKNKDKFDINTMDIKSHLDASFDIDNIKVSEELIARTLKAVKASENGPRKSTDMVQEDFVDLLENNNNTDNVINIESKRKKTIFAPMKIATVAAALFVFVVGIYAMNNGVSNKNSGSNSHKKSESSSGSIVSDDSAAYEIPAEGSVELDEIIVTQKQDIESETADYGITNENASDEAADKKYNIAGDNSFFKAETLLLSNLYPIQNKTISEFTIKDVNNKLICTTIQIEKVKEVYEILDEHPLTIGENKTLEYIYQFDILTDDGQSYTILIGSGIYAKTSDELEYTYYEIDNSDELLVRLKDFISTMP